MMKTKNISSALGGFWLLLFLAASCKPFMNIQPENPVLPQDFVVKSADSAGQSAGELSFREYFDEPELIALIDSALLNNLDLLAANQRIEQARAYVTYARGLGRPQVDAFASVGARRFGKYTMDGVGNFDTNFSDNITPDQRIPEHLPDFYIGVQSSWEIDIFRKYKDKKQAAAERFLASYEGRNFVITNLIAEIASNYYELLALDNELLILRENIALQEDALEIINIQKEAGNVTELAINQFEAQIYYSRSLEFELLRQIILHENNINFLLGRYPQAVNRNLEAFNEDLPVEPEIGLPADLLKNRPDIRESALQLSALKFDLRAAEKAFYPSLNITGALGFNSFNPSFFLSLPSIAYGVFSGLSMPLINRNALKAEFEGLKAAQTEGLYRYQRTILQAYIEVYNQLANLRNLESIYEFRRLQVTKLDEAVVSAGTLFQNGRASYFEVLITQQNVLQAKLDLVIDKKRQYFALIDLYKALGGGAN